MDTRIPAEVFPPGAFIKEELEERGWTQDDLAKILDKPLPTMNQILNGKRAVIPDTALRLAAAFDTSAEFWMNLESAWQLRQATQPSDVSRVRARARLYETAPIRELERRGWIKKTATVEEMERELASFFCVKNLDEVPSLRVAARASSSGALAGMNASQWAWGQRACHVAKLVEARRFSADRLEKAIIELRGLMREPEEIRHVPKVLAVAGVRFVIVEHLTRTKMDGAALWLSPSTPIVAVSLRYGRLDHFWFTLLHELAHIKNGDGVRLDIDILNNPNSEDEIEALANSQAASWLVEPKKMQSFIDRTTPHYSTQRIENFSSRMNVHPSIVVGQLKFREEFSHNRFVKLQNVDVRDTIRNASIYDGWGRAVLTVRGQET